MKASIKITSNYGFDHNWTLVLEGKASTKYLYLGQDVKVCSRLLQMTTRDVVTAIETKDIDEGTIGNRRLAKFILKTLKENHLLTPRKLMKTDDWYLSVS